MYEIEHRYRSDATFAMAVDTLRGILARYEMTPSELRQAVMLAAYLHELENPVPRIAAEARVRAELERMRAPRECPDGVVGTSRACGVCPNCRDYAGGP